MVFTKKEPIDPEVTEWGFCDTCACFVLSPGGSRDLNGKCHLKPAIYPITMANMSWCKQWCKGKQRSARSTSQNPTGEIPVVDKAADVAPEAV